MVLCAGNERNDTGDMQVSTLVVHLGELKTKCIFPAKSLKPNSVKTNIFNMLTTNDAPGIKINIYVYSYISLRSDKTSGEEKLTLFRTPLRRRQLLQHLVSISQIG